MQNQNKPLSQKYMSRKAEIIQFSFEEETVEHKASMVLCGERQKGKKAQTLYWLSLSNLFSGLMDYSYQCELKWNRLSGVVHLQLI